MCALLLYILSFLSRIDHTYPILVSAQKIKRIRTKQLLDPRIDETVWHNYVTKGWVRSAAIKLIVTFMFWQKSYPFLYVLQFLNIFSISNFAKDILQSLYLKKERSWKFENSKWNFPWNWMTFLVCQKQWNEFQFRPSIQNTSTDAKNIRWFSFCKTSQDAILIALNSIGTFFCGMLYKQYPLITRGNVQIKMNCFKIKLQ